MIEILISNLDQPYPNLGYMLIGFYTPTKLKAHKTTDDRHIDCLTIIIEFLITSTPLLAPNNSYLYEQCLELIFKIAKNPLTSAYLFETFDSFGKDVLSIIALHISSKNIISAKTRTIREIRQTAWFLKLVAI